MLTTPHVLLGLYFAFNYEPWVALPAALLSHWLFDFFYPHWNPHLFTEMKTQGRLSVQTLLVILVDLLTAVGTISFLAWKIFPNYSQISLLIACAIMAVLPDVLEAPYYFLKSKHRFFKRLVTFEHLYQARANAFWGSLSQIIIIVVCAWEIYQKI